MLVEALLLHLLLEQLDLHRLRLFFSLFLRGCLFVRLDLGKSKSEVRRLVSGGGARLNDEKVADAGLVVDAAAFGGGRELKLSAGKKKHGIVELAA